jgi:hypothetical protein
MDHTPNQAPIPEEFARRKVLLVTGLLGALVVALSVGIVAVAAGAPVVVALGFGGSSFAATMGLVLGALSWLMPPR